MLISFVASAFTSSLGYFATAEPEFHSRADSPFRLFPERLCPQAWSAGLAVLACPRSQPRSLCRVTAPLRRSTSCSGPGWSGNPPPFLGTESATQASKDLAALSLLLVGKEESQETKFHLPLSCHSLSLISSGTWARTVSYCLPQWPLLLMTHPQRGSPWL